MIKDVTYTPCLYVAECLHDYEQIYHHLYIFERLHYMIMNYLSTVCNHRVSGECHYEQTYPHL